VIVSAGIVHWRRSAGDCFGRKVYIGMALLENGVHGFRLV
jgi:hypothetical protein